MQKGSNVTKETHGLLLSLKMEEGAKEGSSYENIILPQFSRARAAQPPSSQTPGETLLTSGILGSEGVIICCLKPTNF